MHQARQMPVLKAFQFLVILPLTLANFATSSINPQGIPLAQVAEQYVDPEFGFSYTVPEGWQVDAGTLVDPYTFVWENKVRAPELIREIIVIVQPAPSFTSTKDWVDSILEAQGMDPDELSAAGGLIETVIDGVAATQVEHRANDLRTIYTYLLNNGFGYLIILDEGAQFLETQQVLTIQQKTDDDEAYELVLLSFRLGTTAPTIRARAVEKPSTQVTETANSFRHPLDTSWLMQSYGHQVYYPSAACGNGLNLYHTAEDVVGTAGTTVRSVANGTVAWYDPNRSTYPGRVVIVRHDVYDGSTIYSMYAHLQTVTVSQGQIVNAGDPIGTVMSWPSDPSNTHLHWEMRSFLDGRAVCNHAHQAGPGYTNLHPDSYGYTHPSNYISNHQNPDIGCSTYSYSGVVLFEHANCNRDNHGAGRREYSSPTGWINISDFNDVASSIHVASGWSIRVFEHSKEDNNGGSWRCITNSMWDLNVDYYTNGNTGQKINDTISSIEVYHNSSCSGGPPPAEHPIQLYIDANFDNGFCYIDGEGWFNLDGGCASYHDQVSSVMLQSGWSARMYKDTNLSGPSGCLTGTDSDLGNNSYSDGSSMNNSISSVYLYHQSNCPPLVVPPPPPNLSSPADGATVARTTGINLCWLAATGATEYYAEFTGGPNLNLNSGWTSGTCWSLGSQWGGSYQWRVKARNSAGESGWSSTRTLVIKYGTPSNLSASAVSSAQINLSWGASADAPGNIDGYRIYRNGSAIATVGSSTTSYNNTNLNCGTSYSYVVRAYKSTVESDPSSTVSATTSSCQQTPPPPNLSSPADGATVARTTSINLCWQASIGATEYYAEFTGGPSLNLNSGWASGLCWSLGSQWGGSYQWRAKARNSSGESGWSSTRTLVIKYGTPSNLSASAVSASQINLAWGPSADAPGNIDGYRIYRDGSAIATVGSAVTSYSNTGLSNGVQYSYFVKAYKGNVESDPSNTASVTLSSTCYSLNLAVSPQSAGSISANPLPNCNNASQYTAGTVVQLSASANSGYNFSNWSGDVSGSTNPGSVTINSNKNVTANFEVASTTVTLDEVVVVGCSSAASTTNMTEPVEAEEPDSKVGVTGPGQPDIGTGQAICFHIVGTNHSTSLLSTYWSWTVHNASGNIVYDFTVLDYPITLGAGLQANWYLQTRVPIVLPAGNYTFTGSIRWTGGTVSKSTNFPISRNNGVDFDGDGVADLGLWRPSNGTWSWLTSSTAYASGSSRRWGILGDIPLGGDLDGDGKGDPIMWRPSNGTWYWLKSSTAYASGGARRWGTLGDIPLLGDLDGDGKGDLIVWRPSNGTWYWLKSSTAYASGGTRRWGTLGDIPLLGDFDGDGKGDLALWRPSNGTWYWLTSGTAYASGGTRRWGILGDIPLLDDLDGDGKGDVVVWRPSNGTWYWLKSSTAFASGGTRRWGTLGDIPLGGDLDGDGKGDLIVWRPSNGTWYWLTSSSALASGGTRQWGNSGDKVIDDHGR